MRTALLAVILSLAALSCSSKQKTEEKAPVAATCDPAKCSPYRCAKDNSCLTYCEFPDDCLAGFRCVKPDKRSIEGYCQK